MKSTIAGFKGKVMTSPKEEQKEKKSEGPHLVRGP